MPHDFIEHAKRIENALKLAGCPTIAERLEYARLGGATSGEILMGLRYECRAAQPDLEIPPEIRADILALAHSIDETGI